jgi:hypothetical protein
VVPLENLALPLLARVPEAPVVLIVQTAQAPIAPVLVMLVPRVVAGVAQLTGALPVTVPLVLATVPLVLATEAQVAEVEVVPLMEVTAAEKLVVV